MKKIDEIYQEFSWLENKDQIIGAMASEILHLREEAMKYHRFPEEVKSVDCLQRCLKYWMAQRMVLCIDEPETDEEADSKKFLFHHITEETKRLKGLLHERI